MRINAFLTIYNSRRDVYGNVYYAVELTDEGRTLGHGLISADNISTIDCRERLLWHIQRQELPIRQYNRMVKDWPYIGCTWNDIEANLQQQAMQGV